MGSSTSRASGKDTAEASLDDSLKSAAFAELQRKCVELEINFEPSIESELGYIERRKDSRALCSRLPPYFTL